MKKISRRSFLTAAAACGAAAALSACGGSSASSTAASSTAGSTAASAAAGPVTLQWSVWDKESTPYWQAMADGYMASHKDVTIEMVDLGSSDYMTVLATQLAGSADLDIVTIKDIPGYANLINLDYLKPLNEVLTRDTGDFNGTIEQLTTDDGNFYAVPFRSDFWVLYYNKDLFDKAGVEYPSNDLTMEDYDALARKMTSGSGDTKVYGCHYHTWRSAASLFSILDGKNTIIDGKYDFMKPTYDMVIAQQKDGICMDYGYLKTSSLHYSAAFENQQCAMVNMGSWFISTLEAYMKDAETKFNWGIVKYPHPAGAEAGSTLGTVTSLAINADSPKAEAAADFINWCVSEEGAQAIAKTGTFPACGSAATAEIIKSTEGFPEDSNSVDALTTSNVYLEMPYTQYASDIETILNAEHDAIMTMSMDYGYLKTSSLHYSAAFENQQCAMVNMGSWFISTLEAYMKDAETKFNWGIVKYPHPAGAEAGSTLGTVTSLAINADSPKAEAAADFINWCVSEEGAQAIAKTGTFPACGSAATAEIIKSTEGFPEDSNSVDALTTSNVYLEMPYTQYASDIETILNAEHDAIMTMSETVDEGIQNMNDQVPAVLG